MKPRDDEPTRSPAGEPNEGPTEKLPQDAGQDPTERLPQDPADALTEPLDDGRDEGLTASLPSGSSHGEGRRLGFTVLALSILAAVALGGTYVALGGLEYKPAGAADPCDPRPWGSPEGVEATAERFSLAAIDGAACELAVSREELTRALAGEDSRRRFGADHGLTESEVEDAVRAGLLRATADAERGGALGSLAADGIRVAVEVMPMSVMVSLIENAAKLFERDGVGGALGGALDLLDGPADPGSSGESGDSEMPGEDPLNPRDIPGRVGGALTDALKEQLPDDVQKALPDDLGQRVEKGLDSLIGP